jgi:hypothetical protein
MRKLFIEKRERKEEENVREKLFVACLNAKINILHGKSQPSLIPTSVEEGKIFFAHENTINC